MARRRSKKSSPIGCLVLVILVLFALFSGLGSREDKQNITASSSSTSKSIASSAVLPTPTPTAKPVSTSTPTSTATSTPTPTPTPEPTATPKKEYTYVYNKNTKKFHEESCSSADDIKPKNRGEYTGTREEMINKGYDPCKRCKP